MFLVILIGLGFYALWWFTRKQFPLPPVPSAVLVSGAGTGFGRLTSLRLAKLGYTVYSGVVNTEEGDKLLEDSRKEVPSDGGKIIPLVLDITDRKNVEEVYERLSKDLARTGLQALVNNAGIGWSAPLELQPFDDFRKVIEVNLLGHVLMTKTFLPLMRKARAARIINIASLAGVLGAPRMSAYSASKFGIEGFSDCLRRELRHLDISVSVIEPGFAKTAIITSAFAYYSKILPTASPEVLEAYAPILPKNDDVLTQRIYNEAIDPSLVIDCIVDAFTSPHPKTRYLVGLPAQIASRAIWLLPNYVIDWMIETYYLKLLKS